MISIDILKKMPTSDGGGWVPMNPLMPTGGKAAYSVFEVGLGEECQVVQRLKIGDRVYKALPVPSGPIAFDVSAKNGGKIQVYQADELPMFAEGVFQLEQWDFEKGDRKIKGLAPTRRFVVLALMGDGIKAVPRTLGCATRGPSVWQLAPTVHAWAGVL